MSFEKQVEAGMPKKMHFDTKEKARFYCNNGNMRETGVALGEKVLELGPVTKDTVVMDFGCGTGLPGIPLLKHSKKVVFLDPNPAMLEVLQDELDESGEKNYEVIKGIIDDYMGEPVDIMLCSLVIHHLPEPDITLKALFENVKPGGRIIISDFAPSTHRPGWENGELEGLVTAAGFINLARQNWRSLDVNDFTGEDVQIPRFILCADKPIA